METAQKQSIWHYQPLKSCTFLRIVVATPNLVTQARSEQLAAHNTLHKIIEWLRLVGVWHAPDIFQWSIQCNS